MCQSYKITCACNQNTAEIFFGKMVLNETAIEDLYCPYCSQKVDADRVDRVWDNDRVLEMNMDVIRQFAGSLGISPQESIYILTEADRIFVFCNFDIVCKLSIAIWNFSAIPGNVNRFNPNQLELALTSPCIPNKQLLTDKIFSVIQQMRL